MPLYDATLIYREAAMIGPPLHERLIARTRVPLVFDIDEPMFVRYRSAANGWATLLKCPGKTHTLFRLADEVIAVNSLIGSYAADYNPAVSVIPNVVDVDRYENGQGLRDGTVRIVSSGSQWTTPNLHTIAPVLGRLQEHYGGRVVLRLVGAAPIDLPGVRIDSRVGGAQRPRHPTSASVTSACCRSTISRGTAGSST